MQPCRDSAFPDAGITVRRRRVALAFALLACLLHAGCGAGAPSVDQSTELVLGAEGGAVTGPQLSAAARLAERFATAYARSAYLRHPPWLPGGDGARASLDGRSGDAGAALTPRTPSPLTSA